MMTTAAEARRLRQRSRANARLRLIGLGAVMVSALALGVLLYSVVAKAVSALTEHYVTIEGRLDPAAIDPTGSGDPATIAAADWNAIARDAMRAEFAHVTGRKPRKELNALTSGDAGWELRDEVLAGVVTPGEAGPLRMLLSDDAQLYVKGAYGRMSDEAGRGAAALSAEGDTLRVVSTEPDFAAAAALVKAALAEQAARLERQAGRQLAGVAAREAELAAEGLSDAQRAAKQADVARYSAEARRLSDEAAALRLRAADPASEEALSADLPSLLVQINGGWIKADHVSPNSLSGEALAPLAAMDAAAPRDWRVRVMDRPEGARRISDAQAVWLEQLQSAGKIDTVFNTRFFSGADSREAELAGVWGALMGSMLTMLVTLALSAPIGVLAAIYLEEFAPKNTLTNILEVNINNLAAVPSIVFGLLGVGLFLTVAPGLRSAPLIGGMVLALMTLPTIIIASRAAIKAVPPSIRAAALGLGASRSQVVFHHVLPLAAPGILTGAIIGMAQALGETAPLMMVGMIGFFAQTPGWIYDPATVMPGLIYSWSDHPEKLFELKTALAILTLLAFLVVMNGLAVLLRKRFERRW